MGLNPLNFFLLSVIRNYDIRREKKNGYNLMEDDVKFLNIHSDKVPYLWRKIFFCIEIENDLIFSDQIPEGGV